MITAKFATAVSSFKTFRDQDDPKSVPLVLEVTDMEKFGALMNDPKIQATKEQHTVKEPLIVSIPVSQLQHFFTLKIDA